MTKLLYVGSIIPDLNSLITPAFSRAGNMCQYNLLQGLKRLDILIDKILSVYPVPSFPSTKKVVFSKQTLQLDENLNIELLPFLNITPLKQLAFGLTVFFEILRWGKKVKDDEPKVIFTFNISVPPGFFIIQAARIIDAKVVAMIYDINVPGETVPRSPAWIIDYWMHKKILPEYDGLVVIADAIAHDMAPSVPFLRVEGGIKSNLAEQYTSIENETARDAHYFTIVAAGGLEEANGIREILAAFALLTGKRYRLWIAGDGTLEGVVREAAACDPRIRYAGFVSFNEVLKLYAAADVLVNMRLTQRLNTRYFFPSKIMEYLTTGVPVISTCPGNMADEYGRFAYLLKDETPESLAEMLKLVDQTSEVERHEKSRAARQYMVQHKTWDVQSRRIGNFLATIVNRDR